MHFTTLATLGLTASVAMAAPRRYPHKARQSSSGQNVVYWGQGPSDNSDLTTYCSSDAGIDVVVLSFLYEYGNGVNFASGNIGPDCTVSSSGEGTNCDTLASAIETCQSNGVKVILSLGGASGSYSLTSADEAQTIGQNLWESYGSGSGSGPRPFGDTSVDGWDFDIEAYSGNQYYQQLISTLRGNFASNSTATYYITGAPQCPIPEPNMQVIVENAQFDYLWVQFYNNPGCSTNSGTNFDDWVSNVANTPSSGAKIFLGVPASPDASTGTSSGSQYYLDPADLATLVGKYSSNSAFGGIMMWDAGYSDANVNNGCTYAQEAAHILSSGSAC